MPRVVSKRGTAAYLKKEPLQDGLLSFTTYDWRIHLDYVDENYQLKRKTLYSGKLTFGNYTYDGTKDVNVDIYKGEIK